MTSPRATSVRLSSGDVELEARWDLPHAPHHIVVLCHPHPLHQGTMTAPLMEGVARSLCMRGFAVLRFNFRGVGTSTGSHDYGVGEVDDVHAAAKHAEAEHPTLPIGLAGWSFGAVTALRWQARERSGLPYVGIAPPVSSTHTPTLPAPHELAAAHRTFVVGDRDQFVEVEELSSYAASIGAETEVLLGSDHFFYFREERVAAAVADALTATD